MKKYYIKTYGCQMNTSDSERIASRFDSMGYAEATTAEDADVVVFNSCSVRQSAEDRVYGQLNKMNALKKTQNERKVKVILTGCMAKREIVKKKALAVDHFMDIRDLHKLPEMLGAEAVTEEEYFEVKPKFSTKYTAYIPIMTGCNNHCTFCIVPTTRGKEISRPVQQILDEVSSAISAGYKEIFLLGQNVNSYAHGFSDLLRKINQLPGDFWVRFVSSHPKDMSDDLIAVITEGSHITPYVHFALQSGDREVLRRMARTYTPEHYLEIVKKLRAQVKDLFLATDIIVGFPGETEAQFQKTAQMFRDACYDMAYINQYSPREGTPSARLFKDDVSTEEKHRREFELNELLKITARENGQPYVGRTVRALVTGVANDGQWMGKDWSYHTVKFPKTDDQNLLGQFAEVKITEAKDFGLAGALSH